MRGALLPPESAITSVFFRRRSPVTGAAHALALDILGEQSLASSRHGTGVQTEQIGDAAVTAVAELEGLQPGVQAAMAFVEQRAEQDSHMCLARCCASCTALSAEKWTWHRPTLVRRMRPWRASLRSESLTWTCRRCSSSAQVYPAEESLLNTAQVLSRVTAPGEADLWRWRPQAELVEASDLRESVPRGCSTCRGGSSWTERAVGAARGRRSSLPGVSTAVLRSSMVFDRTPERRWDQKTCRRVPSGAGVPIMVWGMQSLD